VVKHAGARHVDVRLEGDAGGLTVTVADDGRGIGPDVTAGVGLLSLRERAEELGGRCEVQCPESGGTTVRAVLPYGTATGDTVSPTTTSSMRRSEPVRSTR
jgi:two-component system, NarL family, sensor kinase